MIPVIQTDTPHSPTNQPNEPNRPTDQCDVPCVLGYVPCISNSSTTPTDYEVAPVTDVIPVNSHPMKTRAKNVIYKPKVFLTDFVDREPTNVQDALKCPHLVQAMTDEYTALMKKYTWVLVPLPMTKRSLV